MIAENRTFKDRRINLDGASFYRCEFKGCTLVYSAVMEVNFENCNFSNDCTWQFAGPAGNMLSFMAVLYGSGAKELIESTINQIRGQAGPAES